MQLPVRGNVEHPEAFSLTVSERDTEGSADRWIRTPAVDRVPGGQVTSCLGAGGRSSPVAGRLPIQV